MTPKSAKAKGRLAQQHVRNRIRDTFNLQEDDVRSTGMGQSGEDIQLSPAARDVFPFSIEVKAQERVSIWDAFKQATTNAQDHTPLLILKRNRSDYLAVLTLEDLLKILERK